MANEYVITRTVNGVKEYWTSYATFRKDRAAKWAALKVSEIHFNQYYKNDPYFKGCTIEPATPINKQTN